MKKIFSLIIVGLLCFSMISMLTTQVKALAASNTSDPVDDLYYYQTGSPAPTWAVIDIVYAEVSQVDSENIKLLIKTSQPIPLTNEWQGYIWLLDTGIPAPPYWNPIDSNDIDVAYSVAVHWAATGPLAVDVVNVIDGTIIFQEDARDYPEKYFSGDTCFITIPLSWIGNPTSIKWVANSIDGVASPSGRHDKAPNTGHATLTISSARTQAIKNIVNIDNVNVELDERKDRFRWLSVQQNFYVVASDGTIIYWAQNIVEIWATGILWFKHVWIRSVFQVFPYGSNDPVLDTEPQTRFSRALVSEPFVLNLTSHIEEDLLILENNASPRRRGKAFLAIPEGSSIMGSVGFHAPQISLVGTTQYHFGEHPFNSPIAVFEYPTSGQVECYSKLVGEDTWRSTVNRVFGVGESQTGEESRNLHWWPDGSFLWHDGLIDQGISFTPDY